MPWVKSFEKSSEEDTSVPVDTWEFAVGDGSVVVRADTPSLFYLNATAAVLWTAYKTTNSWERAADALVERFDVPRGTAVRDVLSTLKHWSATGLLGAFRPAVTPRWDGQHGEPKTIAYCSVEGTSFLLQTDLLNVVAEIAPRLEGIRIEPCTPDVSMAVWRIGDDLFAIVAGEECIAVEQGVRAARAVLFQEIVKRGRPGREWMALLHASACGIDGRCILFPAASFSGKSTLAAALMASGFALYSDDFAGIEKDRFRIPPMPFAIAVRQGSWDVLRDWIPEIDDAMVVEAFDEQIKFLPVPRASTPPPGQPVALVFSEWLAGADVAVQSLTVSDVIARLNESGFWVCHERARIGEFLAWLERVPKYSLRYGDLAQAVAQVKAIV